MKLFLLLGLTAFGGDLGGIKSVYVLPMANGLDQFLAMKLTGVFQVVTDPKKADAVITDHVGAGFENQLEDLYGAAQKTQEENLFAPQKRSSAPMKARGAVFLVDVKSRNVLWSDYEHLRNTQPADIHRAAEKIASKLAKEINARP